MIYPTSILAIFIFLAFVGFTLALSFYLGRRATDSSGYFAAHGQIPWFINGVAFAGDYLSAASFLGICGMIAFYGYDGFLYSIGYLAGWIVALFVIAEPMKRLGKYTFADALNAKFQSKGIQCVAGISTLAVSVFYLIPQMVGAGALVKPLLGLPHWMGVMAVGGVVIFIVVTAGMVSTTWVQFIKGSLLVVFSAVLAILILQRGLTVHEGGVDGYAFLDLPVDVTAKDDMAGLERAVARHGFELNDEALPESWIAEGLHLLGKDSHESQRLCLLDRVGEEFRLMECQTIETVDQQTVYNRLASADGKLHPVGYLRRLPEGKESTGSLGPIEFLRTLERSEVVLWRKKVLKDADGRPAQIFYPKPTPGEEILVPGEHPTFAGIRKPGLWPKLDFLSLMFALFCGTASLPHILIRYYTVKDGSAARKSTIVGIAAIGGFYVLTLFLGLGAMTSGALDPTNDNMAAPLLARSISEGLFAIISAIAFTTVLGTVSGLILASAGAVSHDLLKHVVGLEMSDHEQVRIAKIASVLVGVIAILLGIGFEKMNVSFLVGWAFSVAASANLPALVMLLFWSRTTKQGIVAAVLVGMISSLGWILLSEDTFSKVYAISRPDWLGKVVPFSQPGIVTIPLAFLTLVIVSLLTGKQESAATD
jgi:cation/acetate symporter